MTLLGKLFLDIILKLLQDEGNKKTIYELIKILYLLKIISFKHIRLF